MSLDSLTESTVAMLLDAAPDPMIVVNAGGKIVLLNTQATKLFGYTRVELTGQPVEVLVSETVRPVHAGYRAAFLTNPHARAMDARTPLVARRKDGSEFAAEISLNPLQLAEGPVVVAAIRDTSRRLREEEEQRVMQAKLQQSQKLESLGVLAGGIAHDFNNLLTSIMGNAGMAIRQMAPESPAFASVMEIEHVSERAADLVRQLLAYSGKGHFVIKAVDLSRIVEEMSHLLQAVISKKAVLRFDFFPGLPTINADATQLRQIVMNLITNASDAIGDRSGIITLRTGMIHVDHRYLMTTQLYDDLPAGDYVYLEVTDTGHGMDEATKAKVFDPFFTTKFTGRGLGLAAVLGIVRGHNGTIKIYSEVSRGTTFKVLLPCNELAGPAQDDHRTPRKQWRGKGTIMIADDEETVRSILAKVLGATGFDVIQAVDGRDAVNVFAQNAGTIKLALIDLTMPHKGGEDVFTEIRRIRPDIPVILMSGYTEEEVTSIFSGKGMQGFIQKPFRIDDLLDTIHDIIGGDSQT